MATKKDIIITIGVDGNVSLKVEGVGGGECLDFTKFLEEGLGEVVERVRTNEFYQSEQKSRLNLTQSLKGKLKWTVGSGVDAG